MMYSSSSPIATSGNVIDRAADSADEVLRATQRAADAALDKVSEKIHGLRDTASPVVDRITAPFDAASNFTQEAPLKSLLIAAAAGAVLMAVFSLITRAGHAD